MSASAVRRQLPLLLVIVGALLLALLDGLLGDGALRAEQARREALYRRLAGTDSRLAYLAEASDDSLRWYRATDGSGCLALVTGLGYSGPFTLAVAFDRTSVRGVATVTHRETAGYGGRVLDNLDWLAAFAGQRVATAGETLRPSYRGGAIDVVSGATITSDAAIRRVAEAALALPACRGAAATEGER